MKLLVTGGSKSQAIMYVRLCLNTAHEIQPITCLIHGGAPGVDSFAAQWARANQIDQDPHRVSNEEWIRYGNYAGLRRNGAMLEASKPDVVMAFEGGRGTTDMVVRATRGGYPVCATWLDDWIERYRAHAARFKLG